MFIKKRLIQNCHTGTAVYGVKLKKRYSMEQHIFEGPPKSAQVKTF
jgi:hypothetical protein